MRLNQKDKEQYFGEILGSCENEKVISAISQEKDQLKNVIKGLSGLSNANPVLGKQIAINAAILVYITKGGDVVELYKKCMDVINSGTSQEKIRSFISKIGGNVNTFDSLFLKSKQFRL